MTKKAIENFYFLKNSPQKIQAKLVSIFKNKKISIKEIKLLKDKLIIDDQYKITALVTLGKNLPSKIILEIHDNGDYFARNLFALKEFKKIRQLKTAKLYGFLPELKIIIREYIEGDFLIGPFLKEGVNLNQIKKMIRKFAERLADIHNLKIKRSDKFLFKKLNQKVEKKILNRTIEFIKPNIKSLQSLIKKNLRALNKKTDSVEKGNKNCLIHGDYQLANFIQKNNSLYLTDFDTIEIGNPFRDLGRFLFQLTYFLKISKKSPPKKIKELENLFLESYLNYRPHFQISNFQVNLNLYKAQMIQYLILGKIWGERTPNHKEIKQLLNEQSKLLKI